LPAKALPSAGAKPSRLMRVAETRAVNRALRKDIRNTWRDTDAVGGYTVFNIKGNRYRLITKINYKSHVIFIKSVCTHAEYDKEQWKVTGQAAR
jgi:mRNA-degrading endonuclease HigB of HigAB toxin-antitoxin module